MPTLPSGIPAWASASATAGGSRLATSAANAQPQSAQLAASNSRMSKSGRQGIDHFQRPFDEQIHFFVVDHVRRHEINRIADRAQQQFPVKCCLIKLAHEARILRFDFERPYHAGIAKMSD